MTDNSSYVDNMVQATDKVYVQLIDGTTAWVPTNAQKLGDNQYLILPDKEFDESDPVKLYEFIQGDIVAVEPHTFQDGTTGSACRDLIQASSRPDKKYFEFLFKATLGQLEINASTYDAYFDEIELMRQQTLAGQYFYPDVVATLEQLHQSQHDNIR